MSRCARSAAPSVRFAGPFDAEEGRRWMSAEASDGAADDSERPTPRASGPWPGPAMQPAASAVSPIRTLDGGKRSRDDQRDGMGDEGAESAYQSSSHGSPNKRGKRKYIPRPSRAYSLHPSMHPQHAALPAPAPMGKDGGLIC